VIKSLFYSKNYQKAKKTLKYLWNEKNNMPESFQEFLKNIKRKFQQFV
jgi:hypothetical protein